MYFLNLSLAQFLALFGTVSATLVVLYLLDRSRRRQVVATLRFWIAADQPSVVQRRKRIRQPLSLLLQLLSLLLLLLAIAQLRFGAPLETPRDHVLILDTSAWMAASSKSSSDSSQRRTLMDDAHQKALAYLKAAPAADRIMLVRADALATPVTGFESNRRKVVEAISLSKPGSTALNLEQALAFARKAQALSSGRSGEIVYAGPGRIAEPQTPLASTPEMKNLRVLSVADPVENCGFRKIAVERATTDPEIWEVYVTTRNYGAHSKPVVVTLTFGGALVGARKLTIPPGADRQTTFEYRTRAGGLLEANLAPHDALPEDDHAVLELPAEPALSVLVYSAHPELLAPIVTSIPRMKAVFRKPAQYTAAAPAGLLILDAFRPPAPPQADAIWIEPPADGSPVPVRAKLQNIHFERWCSDNPLCAGLRTRDLRLSTASVYECAPDDIRIGQAKEGPVIVARGGKHKTVVFGFHPANSDLRYELATPLLFANILRWMAPDLFRHSTVTAGSVGMVSVDLEKEVRPQDVRVLQQDGTALPYTIRAHTLRFFSGTPGTARIMLADRELVYSLTLPELWETKWEPPPGVKRGVPNFRESVAASHDLWQGLAALGGLGLLLEWVLFGRASRLLRRTAQLEMVKRRVRKAS